MKLAGDGVADDSWVSSPLIHAALLVGAAAGFQAPEDDLAKEMTHDLEMNFNKNVQGRHLAPHNSTPKLVIIVLSSTNKQWGLQITGRSGIDEPVWSGATMFIWGQTRTCLLFA